MGREGSHQIYSSQTPPAAPVQPCERFRDGEKGSKEAEGSEGASLRDQKERANRKCRQRGGWGREEGRASESDARKSAARIERLLTMY